MARFLVLRRLAPGAISGASLERKRRDDPVELVQLTNPHSWLIGGFAVTISSDLVSNSPWKVTWAQQVTNVTAGTTSTITFSGTGSLTCTVSTTFVTDTS